MTLFRGISFELLEDGEYIQFFGVHMLSWGDIERATGIKPTIAFIEDDTLEKQNAALVAALKEIDKLFSSRQGLDWDWGSQEEKDAHQIAQQALDQAGEW